jgi:hypothetical protein
MAEPPRPPFGCRASELDRGVIYVIGVADLQGPGLRVVRERQQKDKEPRFWLAEPDFSVRPRDSDSVEPGVIADEVLTVPRRVKAVETEVQAEVDYELLVDKTRPMSRERAIEIWRDLRPHIMDSECTMDEDKQNESQSVWIDGRWFPAKLFEPAEIEKIKNLDDHQEHMYRVQLQKWIEMNYPAKMDLKKAQREEKVGLGTGLRDEERRTMIVEPIDQQEEEEESSGESGSESEEESESEHESAGENEGEDEGAREVDSLQKDFKAYKKSKRWPTVFTMQGFRKRLEDLKAQVPTADKKAMQDFIREYQSEVLPKIKQADELLVRLQKTPENLPTVIPREDHETMAQLAKESQSPDLDFIIEGWQEEIRRRYGDRFEALRRSVANHQKSGRWLGELEMGTLKSELESPGIAAALSTAERADMRAFFDEYFTAILPKIYRASELGEKFEKTPAKITEEDIREMARLRKEVASVEMDAIGKDWDSALRQRDSTARQLELMKRQLALFEKVKSLGGFEGRSLPKSELEELKKTMMLTKTYDSQPDAIKEYMRKGIAVNNELEDMVKALERGEPMNADDNAKVLAIAKSAPSDSIDALVERWKDLYTPPLTPTALERSQSIDLDEDQFPVVTEADVVEEASEAASESETQESEAGSGEFPEQEGVQEVIEEMLRRMNE